jgi:hypothetical protein
LCDQIWHQGRGRLEPRHVWLAVLRSGKSPSRNTCAADHRNRSD